MDEQCPRDTDSLSTSPRPCFDAYIYAATSASSGLLLHQAQLYKDGFPQIPPRHPRARIFHSTRSCPPQPRANPTEPPIDKIPEPPPASSDVTARILEGGCCI